MNAVEVELDKIRQRSPPDKQTDYKPIGENDRICIGNVTKEEQYYTFMIV